MDLNEFKKQMSELDENKIIDDCTKFSILKENLSKIDKNSVGTMNLVIAIEEMAECQQQIAKYIRGKYKTCDKAALLEEVTDVYLALEWVKYICDLSELDLSKAMTIKLNRLHKRHLKESEDK